MTHDEAVLASKLALEREVMVPLYRALSAYIMAWSRADGQPTLFERQGHQSAIEKVLGAHYARVACCMSGRVPPRGALIEDAALSVDHARSLRSRAEAQARRYIEATDRELAELLAAHDSQEVKASQGRGGGFSVLVEGKLKATAEQAHARARRRAQAAANVETEETAEETRFEWVKQSRANARIVKVWKTMLDERVRPTHRAAEGQEQFVDVPFEVGGAQLMHPGDQSLGAPLREIINCRCQSVYYAALADGSREPIGLETPHVPAKRTWHPGDRLGKETPVNPTSLVTLNGKTRARIVLGDGSTFATMRQTTPSTIEILVNRQVVARATTQGETVASLTIAQGWEAQGMEKLIRDSVAHSARREWMRPNP